MTCECCGLESPYHKLGCEIKPKENTVKWIIDIIDSQEDSDVDAIVDRVAMYVDKFYLKKADLRRRREDRENESI